MALGLEPAFTHGRPVWPLAGKALADQEPDDPDLAIPRGALQNGIREAPERFFAANHNSLITHRPAEPLGPKPTKTLELKWKLALLASCVFHAALALFFIQATDEAVYMEGAEFSGIEVLGSAADQVEAGETSEVDEPVVDVTMVTMLEALPVQTIEAERVPSEEPVPPAKTAEAVTAGVEVLTPIEAAPVERVKEAAAEPVQPEKHSEAVAAERQAPLPVERAEPEAAENNPASAVTETAPEVLATDRAELVDDDNFVQKPAETQAAEPVDADETARAESAEASATAKAEPPDTSKVETAEVTKTEPSETKPAEKKAEPAKPGKEADTRPAEEKKPTSERKTAKSKTEQSKKVADKAKAKPKKSGNRGRADANAVRGQVDGKEKGDSKQASRGGSKNGAVGNAAVSNYPGKVRSKLARVARSVRAKGNGEVIVAFAVGSNGGVRSARVTRSSGVASVDQAALQAVRKASPFPPIPANAGRSTWEFSIPLAFMR